MRRFSLLLITVLAVACGGSADSTAPPPPPPPPPPPSGPTSLAVQVPTTLIVGQTATATVSPTTAVVWTSSASSVATVSSTGFVTAIAAGVDTISATASNGVVGRAVVTVSAPAPPIVFPSGTVMLSLGVGQATTFVPSANPAGFVPQANSDYVFIAANTDTVMDAVGTYSLASDDLGVSANASVAPSASFQTPVKVSRVAPNIGVRMEGQLRSYERTHLTQYGRTAFARIRADKQRRSIASGVSASMNIGSGIQIGDVRSMNMPLTGDACSHYATVTAKVVAIGAHAVIMADTASASGGFASSDYSQIANEFDSIIYPTDTTYFGSPSDLDNNGRVVLLFTPEVNKLTPRGSVGYYGGFFFAGDLLPPSQCTESNEGEIFYLLSPDPAGVFGMAHTTSAIRQATRGTVAHEFQHMINAGHRLALGTGFVGFEQAWLDEGLAHMAEDLVGRAEDSRTATQRLSWTDIHASSDNYAAFYYQNMARFGMWEQVAGQAGALSAQADTSLAVRGAIWSLLRHNLDVRGPAFIRGVLAGTSTGLPNLTSHSNANWDRLVDEWLVANVVDGVAGTTQGYASYDIHGIETAMNSTTGYPLLVTTVAAGHVSYSGTAASGSGNYYLVHGNGNTVVNLKTANKSGPANFNGVRFLAVRIR